MTWFCLGNKMKKLNLGLLLSVLVSGVAFAGTEPAVKMDAKPVVKAEAKSTAAEPTVAPAAKVEAVKPEAKVEVAKPEVKVGATKPVVKSEVKPTVKVESKKEVVPVAK
jgi:hypothetical protein